MATIKELVQKEAEAFEKSRRLKKSVDKMANYNQAVSETAKEAKKTP